MAMLCYVLAALCLVYCVGVVATKAAGTKFYLIWLAGTALFGLFGFFIQKGLWMRLPIGLVIILGKQSSPKMVWQWSKNCYLPPPVKVLR